MEAMVGMRGDLRGRCFLDYPKDTPVVRRPEVLLLILLAVLAVAETFVETTRFDEKKLHLRRRFQPFREETPRLITSGELVTNLAAEPSKVVASPAPSRQSRR